MRGGSSAIPSHKPASAAAGNGGKGGVGNPAGISGESSGMEIQQRERRPLPWRTVGVGQHRRVLLPTSSTGGGDCARSDGLVGPGGSAIPPLDDDGMGTEVNGSSTGFSGGTSGVGGPGASAGARRGDAVTALGGKDGREKGTKGGCSLAHASRCLHNVMYLCAAHAQVRAREGKVRHAAVRGAGVVLPFSWNCDTLQNSWAPSSQRAVCVLRSLLYFLAPPSSFFRVSLLLYVLSLACSHALRINSGVFVHCVMLLVFLFAGI